MLNWDTRYGPSLDIFDPFDELDNFKSTNSQWLTRPSFLEASRSRVSRKYRITLDCSGYEPGSIKTEVKDNNKITVSAKEDQKAENGDFSTQEFRKTFNLPENSEIDKCVSFITHNGTLVIEVPLKNEKQQVEDDFEDLMPRTVDTNNGGKQMQMKCTLPKGFDPSKLSVTCKDRDLIIKAEDNKEKPDSISRMYYYKRILPENTDFSSLKCNLNENKLYIEAPIQMGLPNCRQIPFEYQK